MNFLRKREILLISVEIYACSHTNLSVTVSKHYCNLLNYNMCPTCCVGKGTRCVYANSSTMIKLKTSRTCCETMVEENHEIIAVSVCFQMTC